jgi:hypothetical protein
MQRSESEQLLAEMKEFAGFTAAEQNYIRRSLEVAELGLDAEDRVRGTFEASRIRLQAERYAELEHIRSLIPDDIEADRSLPLLDRLTSLTSFDLLSGKLGSFAAYRFLYERLIGVEVRPWLLSAFCAAAALPCIHPELRRELMFSLQPEDLGAGGWSNVEPVFFPEWVEKVPAEFCC